VGEIVQAHGGSVMVTDAAPGARFEVELPAYPD
jgi:signal transduction histidine kinase